MSAATVLLQYFATSTINIYNAMPKKVSFKFTSSLILLVHKRNGKNMYAKKKINIFPNSLLIL